MVRPYLPPTQPTPPPRVSPASPVWVTIPAGMARPNACAFAVQLAQQDPGLGSHGSRFGVHANPLHLPKIDDHPAVAHAQPRVAVAAASHRGELLLIAGEANRGDHVGDACALGNQGRAAVDRAVPDHPLAVVRRVARANQRPAKRRPEVLDHATIELHPTCERAHEYPPAVRRASVSHQHMRVPTLSPSHTAKAMTRSEV